MLLQCGEKSKFPLEGLVPGVEDGCSQEMAMSYTWGRVLQHRIPHATGGALAWKQAVPAVPVEHDCAQLPKFSVSPYLSMLLSSEYLIKECSCQMNTFVIIK